MKRSIVVLLLAISILLTGCDIFISFLDENVEISTAISAHLYGAEVVGADILHCPGGNSHCNPSSVLGKPDDNFVALGGPGGSIAIRMEESFTNGEGIDLHVYEEHGVKEPFDVQVSKDNLNWITVATSVRDDSGKSYASIDIGLRAGSGMYSYVRILDRSTQTGRPTPGSDIDAVEALWTR